MNSIRVLLADDHTLVRGGIRALLGAIKDVQVIAEANDGREALRMIAEHHPDIVLMDIAMAGMNGLEATARITHEYPDVHVVILSMHTNEEYVLQSLRSGAVGYLLKDADLAELELAIKSVAAGETYLSPPVSKHVISDYVRRVGLQFSSPADPAHSPLERLTSRQREVLQLIAEGYTTQEIAQKLHLSVKTVETHRTQIMERLDIHDVAGLVRFSIRSGLVSLDT